MSHFKKLFSVSSDAIRRDVIITPFLGLEYFRQHKGTQRSKGFLFEVLAEQDFTAIKTGVGASFVGDVVLYLRDTPCRRLYFIGSCAAVRNFDVGDILIANRALAAESFSELLKGKFRTGISKPRGLLTEQFLEFYRHSQCGIVATLGSLSLQERLRSSLLKQGVNAVDMETSAFFSAAWHSKFDSLALLYVTDNIGKHSFCLDIDKQERALIQSSRSRAIELLCSFITRKNG